MSIGKEILEILNTPTHYHKGVPINMFMLPVFGNYKPRSIKNSLYSLRKNGHVDTKGENFILTSSGQKYINKSKSLKEFGVNTKDSVRNLLVLYDIPEHQSKERRWFRRHLRKFNFLMIQRSVWVGPSPLSKEFLDYVKSIGLKDFIKTFKLEKGYNFSK